MATLDGMQVKYQPGTLVVDWSYSFSITLQLQHLETFSTKAGGIEMRPLSEHQNYGLENVNRTTATLIKFCTENFVQVN
jgi:hypothetical protein